MCLLSNKPPIVLKRSMKVYKILRVRTSNYNWEKYYFSAVMTYLWTKDKLETTELYPHKNKPELVAVWDNLARKGFKKDKEVTVLAEGFHSATSIARIHRPLGSNSVIGEFKIPAGATVYKDNSGLRVSDKIIFIGIISN